MYMLSKKNELVQVVNIAPSGKAGLLLFFWDMPEETGGHVEYHGKNVEKLCDLWFVHFLAKKLYWKRMISRSPTLYLTSLQIRLIDVNLVVRYATTVLRWNG